MSEKKKPAAHQHAAKPKAKPDPDPDDDKDDDDDPDRTALVPSGTDSDTEAVPDVVAATFPASAHPDDVARLTEMAAVVTKGMTAANELKPVAGPLDTIGSWVVLFFPSEAKPILDLFDGEFQVHELWDALDAVAELGRKAEKFLEGPAVIGSTMGPKVLEVMPASTVGPHDLCLQLDDQLRKAEPLSKGASVTADSPVKMNPVLAGILLALAKRVAEELLARLNTILAK